MSSAQIIDFTDQPKNSVQRQVIAAEQIGILSGFKRPVARRLGKTVYLILVNYPPESLFENKASFVDRSSGKSLEFHFSTHPQELDTTSHTIENKLGSLRRAGEKCAEFELTGSPERGFDIRFSEPLPSDFEMPRPVVMKQWRRIIKKGDWEEAFAQLAKPYNQQRSQVEQWGSGGLVTFSAEGGDHQREKVLSLVASKTDNPVLMIDSLGRAEWVNLAFRRLVEGNFQDKENVAAVDLLFPLDKECGECALFQKSLNGKKTFNLEFALQAVPNVVEDGNKIPDQPVWIELQVTPVLDEDEKTVRWIAIGTNVTERRKAELAMQAAKEVAESANKAKSDFLAMMSHEIRTPMNAIIGMTELALGTQLTIDQREYLTTANNSAQALLQILNDILDLSKVEAQRLELEQTDFNIADITRETLDTLGVLAQRKDLPLRCNFPLDIHQQLIGDPMRLRQILVNLVGNAIKFTSVGSVDVNVELLDQTVDSVTLHYCVKDTGIGIPEAKTSRIFEAFFQADPSVTRNFGGTGLGLAITSELLRLMGGRMWVESKLGKGSAFHFVLTLKKSKRTFVSLPSDAGQNLRGKRILVIDDNDSNRLAMQRWMDQWGVESQFEATGFDGQETLRESGGHFDLAIVDVVLPDMSGFDVVEDLTKPQSKVRTPILMFSSDDRTATVQRCRAMGIRSYLIKPVSPSTLHKSIQLALGTPQDLLLGQTLMTPGIGIQQIENPLNILVVDDHASNRKLIGEILRRRGHRYREAVDAATAMELIAKEAFQVVLMDVQMPEKDGLEATADIRALPDSNSTVPIIAVTAYVTEDDRKRCLDASMDDYLAKPVSIKDLLDKVERWGNTTRDQIAKPADGTSDDQRLIQDAPNWATQITQTILNAQQSNDPQADRDGQSARKEKSPMPDLSQSLTVGCASATDSHAHPFSLALERFGGDENLLRLQMSFFLTEAPELLQEIQKAIAESDGKSLHLAAHRLKGLVRTYDDDLAGELATKLENISGKQELKEAEPIFVLLAECVAGLVDRIDNY